MSDSDEMDGSGRKRPAKKTIKIQKDTGGKFVVIGKKKIRAKDGITNAEFLQWLIKYLKPKRKTRVPKAQPQRKAASAVSYSQSRDPLELSPDQVQNESLRNYTNTERKRAGLDTLEAPGMVGAPAQLDSDAMAARKAAKEARKAERAAELKKISDERDAVVERAALREKQLKAAQDRTLAEATQLVREYTERQVFAVKDDKALAIGIPKSALAVLKTKPKKLQWHLESKAETPIKALYNKLYQNNVGKFVAEPPPGSYEFTDIKATTKSPARPTRPAPAPPEREHKDPPAAVPIQKLPAMEGSGPDENKAMTNFDIDRVMEPYKPDYLGCIARDDWASLTAPSGRGMSGWVMNTDPKSKPGHHWVAFLMDLDRHTIEYYNSFADKIPDDILVTLKGFIAKHNPTRQYLKLKENRVIDQDANSSNCGWFACKFLIDRFRGRPFRECTKFDESERGEAGIEKFKAKFDTYV